MIHDESGELDLKLSVASVIHRPTQRTSRQIKTPTVIIAIGPPMMSRQIYAVYKGLHLLNGTWMFRRGKPNDNRLTHTERNELLTSQ